MEIKIYKGIMPILANMPVEFVERKGFGHPDTLADMIAMNFSNMYSRYNHNKYGFIPNHWADKVTIVGAQANIGYGFGILKSPINVFQFGRMTETVGEDKIDIADLFRKSVDDIFCRIFGKLYDSKLVKCTTMTHNSSGPDHPKEFYNPINNSDVTTSEPKSNDTIILTAFTPITPLEEMVVTVENYLNSDIFKKNFPATGYDIKLLGARIERDVDLTICIPFIGQRTPSFKFYREQLNEIREILNQMFIEKYDVFKVNLNINTKDFGEYAYLTLIGTSCDKGGCGAVGRGNRFNGLITPNREMAVEAPAGKNPTHHSGRLYSEAIHRASLYLYNECGVPNYLNLVARNGDPLDDPAFVIIKTIGKIPFGIDQHIIEIIKRIFSKTSFLTKEIIQEDPILSHREKALKLRCRQNA